MAGENNSICEDEEPVLDEGDKKLDVLLANAAMSPHKLLPEEVQANKQVDAIVNALEDGLCFEKETIEHTEVDLAAIKPVQEKVVIFSKFHQSCYLSPEVDILREPVQPKYDANVSPPTAPKLSDVILQKMEEIEKESEHFLSVEK